MPIDLKQKRKIINALRRLGLFSPSRIECIKRARVSRGLYACRCCGDIVGPKEYNVDHIESIINPKMGFTTWDSYIDRLFCGVDGLQLLCKDCHRDKTDAERALKKSLL